MNRTFWNLCSRALCLAGAVLAVGTSGKAQETVPLRAYQPAQIEVQVPAVRELRLTREKDEAAEQALAQRAAAGEFWIGVQLKPLDEVALAQLKLKQGVSAERVLPDSPAQKAGVQDHDVLLQFGETAINTPEDLVVAVEKNKDQEAELTVLRGGEKTVLKVQPVKRPQAMRNTVEPPPTADEIHRVEAWLRKLHSGEPGVGPMQTYRVHPGVVLPDVRKLDYPQDLSITVEKQGNEPAKIRVKRGDKSWEATPETLLNLPADVRPYVEHLLVQIAGNSYRSLLEPHFKDWQVGGLKFTRLPEVAPITPNVPPVAPRIELHGFVPNPQGLDEVRRELQDLLKKVDALRSAPRAETPLEQMKREVEQLRKELEELRKSAAKNEPK